MAIKSYLYNYTIYIVYLARLLYHKRRAVDSMFQICIYRNIKCARKTGFPRPGHIYRTCEGHLSWDLLDCYVHTFEVNAIELLFWEGLLSVPAL